jgi:peroxiredoxin Q/BCP
VGGRGNPGKGDRIVKTGDQAPEFDLAADDGTRVRLQDLRGRKVVIFFYPKDNTPGCTIEACAFRDELPRVEESDAVVLGISPDSVASHVKFKSRFGLNYPLLADEEHEVAARYGVWKQKKNFGHTYMGIERTTFFIDEGGRIERVWRKVKVKGHADEVVSAL